MVVDPTVSERIWKPSADGLLDSAEIIVFNDRGSDAKKKDLLRNRIEKLRGNLDGVIYVTHPYHIIQNNSFIERLEGVFI
jgi:hypothetical protein